MEEISPTYLFNTHIEGHILVRNKIPYSVTGGQHNAPATTMIGTSRSHKY